MTPFLEADLVGGGRTPASFRVKQRAQRGKGQPARLGGVRMERATALVNFIESRRQLDEHLAVERVEAHPERPDVVDDADDVLEIVVRGPQRADIGRQIRTDAGGGTGETGVPQLRAPAVLDRLGSMIPARLWNGGKDEAVRQAPHGSI